jgi:hypothetical protein
VLRNLLAGLEFRRDRDGRIRRGAARMALLYMVKAGIIRSNELNRQL